MIIDNGNVHSVATDGRWTPKLNGDIYCSPACGGRCKKADFDHATELANAIATMLGRGWEPRVWENLGWHFEVNKGFATVRRSHIEGQYEAVLQFKLDDHANGTDYFRVTDASPRLAVEEVHSKVSARIAGLKRSLMSISLDVVEIEFNQGSTQIVA